MSTRQTCLTSEWSRRAQGSSQCAREARGSFADVRRTEWILSFF
jgi:hypothetical protein